LIDQDSTLEDICYAVAGALHIVSEDAVLTGGSAAAMYAPDVYTSDDADFVLRRGANGKEIIRALARIGFLPGPAVGTFVHHQSRFSVDFLKGPLAVGAEYLETSGTLTRGDLRLRILTPTDCVRDRLAHFYFWSDYTALNAAVGVAQSGHAPDVDFQAIREWTQRESAASNVDYTAKFDEFLMRTRQT
jgi:hypothetical protein